MQIAMPSGIGAVIALVVLVIVIVMVMIGTLPLWPLGVILGLLALARLL